MQVSPVPASDEVCPPVLSELRAMRCFPGVRSAGCKCLPFLLVMNSCTKAWGERFTSCDFERRIADPRGDGRAFRNL
ncbi:hypothetical protein TNCV_4087911, partial [Trichonephila clavipes]